MIHDPPFRESISWIISPSKFQTATVFLHAHLQVVYYNCVKFHKNSISRLVGVALTRYMPPPPFRESISWIISPFKFWTATIFLHAHLQVVYYKCVKFHKNPISRLGGVALTRYMDERTDGWTDGQGDSYIPPQTLFVGVIMTIWYSSPPLIWSMTMWYSRSYKKGSLSWGGQYSSIFLSLHLKSTYVEYRSIWVIGLTDKFSIFLHHKKLLNS
jgi:hypothetical protein